jgi:uncharacterized protein (DUF302 family)
MRIPIIPIALVASAALAATAVVPWSELSANGGERAAGADGIVKVKSAYRMAETISRLKADIAAKGIVFFQAIDQRKLASDAGITLGPSTLLIFGNPALGSLFITARPEAGLDWPVRLLVHEDKTGQVWATYSDFAWIARRHGITNRQAEFAMATKVIGSITSSVTAK